MIVWLKPNLFPESKSFHIFIRITEWSIPIWSSFKVQIPRKNLDYNRHLIYIYVVNAVLLKVRHINCISPGTTSPPFNSNWTGSTRIQSRKLSTPQSGRDLVSYWCQYTDTSNQLINVSNRTWSTRLQYSPL